MPWIAVGMLASLVLHGCFTGCSLPREGTQSQECTVASQCDDGTPCTDDSCTTEGTCVNDPLPDGPMADQVPQDCLTRTCAAGVYDEIDDATDKPYDDNDCTTDSCTANGPENLPLPAGSACHDANDHAGTCAAGGVCVVDCTPATAATDCDDSLPCTLDTCDVASGSCVHTALDNEPAPSSSQIDGDCQLIMCAAGVVQNVTDDGDVPDDDNQCTTDICTEGTPSNEPVAGGTPCAENGGTVCSDDIASPACVACNDPVDCTALPGNDDCQTRTCVAHACGQSFTAVDTPLFVQQDGDCKLRVCDGAGGQKDNVLQSDVPFDNNDCTSDVCDVNGTPSNPPLVLNTACGVGGTLYCDGLGACVGCTQDAQCASDVFCVDHFCNTTTHVCSSTNRNNNVALPSVPQYAGDPPQVGGDCQQLRCNASGGIQSVAFNTDVPADDGNQCTSESCSNGVPQHPNRAIDFACSQNGGSYCNGTGSCVQCNNSTQCGDPTCLCRVCNASNQCVNQTNGTLAALACQTGGDCQQLQCQNGGTTSVANNVDVPPDEPNVCTTEQCVGGAPQHTNNSANCSDGAYCNGADTCGGGTCSVHAGNPCPGHNAGPNCNDSCNETNDNCTAFDTSGTSCSDSLYCNGADTCNASGSCANHAGNPCPG
ncbi:MAG: hypothetical protein IT373_18390, partial [Polyangiaceae bacterium]|nr:hypothetical protein [Polyangiaceae bacterium]